jgi:signal transduction histidine kinase
VSLIKKLVLAFLLVTMVPLGTIIVVLHHTFVRDAEKQVGTRLEDGVLQVGKSVDEFMFSCIRGMRDLAEDPELTSGDRDLPHKQLSRYIHSFPYFGETRLVDAHGTVIASSSPPEVGTSLFTRFDDTRDEFEQALHGSPGVYISDLSEIPESLHRVTAASKIPDVTPDIQMLTAVHDAAGHTVSVLVADIVTDALGDLLKDLKRRAPGDGSAFLLDKAGLVLMTTDPLSSLLSPHPDVTGGALQASLGENASGYLVYWDKHGRQQMAGYSRLRAYGANQAGNWRLVTLAPYDAILAPVTQSFNPTLCILLATLVGAVGLGLWLARRLARPILELTTSAKTIAAGRFEARVAVNTLDEIGALAEAFNLMAGTVQTEITKRAQAQESLRAANNELEQRVEERTTQLTAEIAERNEAEETLRKANERLHVLSCRLLRIQEDERRHLARELHDQMGQALTAAKIEFEAARGLEDCTVVSRRLDDGIALLDQLLQQVRQLSVDLRPPLLDDLGLVPALRFYLDQHARRAGIHVEFFAGPSLGRAESDIETACFRVAQEALNNVVRHARARTVLVELHRASEMLHLVVRDDGIGFDVVTTQKRPQHGASLGLLGMRERMTLVGGELDFKSEPGHGVEIHAFFPVSPRASAYDPMP